MYCLLIKKTKIKNRDEGSQKTEATLSVGVSMLECKVKVSNSGKDCQVSI